MRRAVVAALAICGAAAIAQTASASVLLVGTYKGIRGKYSSIQTAVNAAKPGDWVLIGPGDYRTTTSQAPKDAPDSSAGVLITVRGLWLRGMNRNTVIVDGTKRGSAPCSRQTSAQNFGPPAPDGSGPMGLNGIMMWKADNVWVQNLTACNFLNGTGTAGNEIWWNGGDASGQIGGWGFYGSYLNATSTYFGGESTAAA